MSAEKPSYLDDLEDYCPEHREKVAVLYTDTVIDPQFEQDLEQEMIEWVSGGCAECTERFQRNIKELMAEDEALPMPEGLRERILRNFTLANEIEGLGVDEAGKPLLKKS